MMWQMGLWGARAGGAVRAVHRPKRRRGRVFGEWVADAGPALEREPQA